MRNFLLLLLLMSYVKITAQNEKISNYKYIIVENKFDFLKKPDQYQTSSFTKFSLKKNGFTVFTSDEILPLDLSQNRCLALFASVKDESSMVTLKNRIVLKDCKGKVVFTSKLGKSKIKEYKKAYIDAIRKAHSTMANLKHISSPLNGSTTKEKTQNIQVDVATQIKNRIVDKQQNTIKTIKNLDKKTAVLYAQSKSNGFQLINTKPEVVYVILNTSLENVFIIEGKEGILYKEKDIWIAEFYTNNKIIKKIYQIKF